MRLHIVCLLGLALGVAACGTPQVALDQANNTVTLIQNLQIELTKYKQNRQLSADRRLKSTQQLDDGTLENAGSQQWSTYLDRESGRSGVIAAQTRLREASDAYAKIIATQDAARDELASRLASITKEPPNVDEKLGAVQKTMAELGIELSARERVAIVSKFIKQAKCIVDQSTKPPGSTVPVASAPPTGSTATTAGCTTKQEGDD